MSGKFWKGANGREMSGNFMWGVWKIYHVIIFIHKITWFLNYKLNFLSFWHITLFPVVLVSSKTHQNWQMAVQARKILGDLSFCLKILSKSRNSSSEMFYVVYFFETRIITLLLYIFSSDILTSVFWITLLKCFLIFTFIVLITTCLSTLVILVNSLWPSDAIWWHRFGSTLA